MKTLRTAKLREFFTANPKSSVMEGMAAVEGSSRQMAYIARRSVYGPKKAKRIKRKVAPVVKNQDQTSEVADLKATVLELTTDLLKFAIVISYLEKQLGLNPSHELKYGSAI